LALELIERIGSGMICITHVFDVGSLPEIVYGLNWILVHGILEVIKCTTENVNACTHCTLSVDTRYQSPTILHESQF
jgi:hypothetical protein